MIWRILLRNTETCAFVWWVFALGATFLYTIDLPSEPTSKGCHLAIDWFRYVECGSGLIGSFAEGPLTWARFWTIDFDVLLAISSVAPVVWPLPAIWFASLILAGSFFRRVVVVFRNRRRSA